MDYPVWRIYTLGSLALVRAWTGHCTEALQLADAAIDAAHALEVAAHPAVTHAHMAAALVHLDRPTSIAPRATSRSPTCRTSDAPPASSTSTSNGRSTPDSPHRPKAHGPALAILRAPAASAHEPPVLVQTNRDLQVRLLIGTGDLVEARTLLDQGGPVPELAAARVDLALATGDVAAANTPSTVGTRGAVTSAR